MVKLKSDFPLLKKEKRLYGVENPIIGLTGGIGTGKTTVGKLLIGKGLIVINADQLIHEIYKEEETLKFLSKLAPEVISKGEINFQKLRAIFFSKPLLKKGLESFLYERLPAFFESKLPKKKSIPVVYDVPLLFEKNLDKSLDFTVVVSAKKDVQIERVSKRDNSDLETIERIIASQMNIEEKIKRANYHIENNQNDDKKTKLKESINSFFDEFFSK